MPAIIQRGSGRPRRRMMNEINVVPYIDVMLVLLIIFMVTAPLVNPGVVDLPSVGKASLPPLKPVEIIIKSDGSLALRDRQKGDGQPRPMPQADVLAYVQQRQAENGEQPVVISGDKNVKYDAVLRIMDELQKRDIKRVGLAVKPAQ